MRIERLYTRIGGDAYDGIGFKSVSVDLRGADGMLDMAEVTLEVPETWSRPAIETLAQRFLAKSVVPAALTAVRDDTLPQWLWAQRPDEKALEALSPAERWMDETSAKQLFDRVAGAWTYWGWRAGRFDQEEDAATFYDEMRHLMAGQRFLPAGPQLRATGLNWAYGAEGHSGGYVTDLDGTRPRKAKAGEETPCVYGAFLQSVEDDLTADGGILDLWRREAQAYKLGAASGANLSALRGCGEVLSTGRRSAGVVRFLDVGDKAASPMRQSSLSRRAPRLVSLDADHPDLLDFVKWKLREDQKAAALAAGARAMNAALETIMRAAHGDMGDDTGVDGLVAGADLPTEALSDPARNQALASAIQAARAAHVPESAVHRTLSLARQGVRELDPMDLGVDWDSETWKTVSGQNTITALRLDHGFMERAESGGDWVLTRRVDGSVADVVDAADVLDRISVATWSTHDPVLHFSGTVGDWNPVPANGPIRTSTAGGEVMFLDDTGAAAGMIGLARFLKPLPSKGKRHDDPVDATALAHTIRLATIALDLSISFGQAPTEALATGIWRTRPIALGMADLAGMLAAAGVAYDSEAGRAAAGALAGMVTATSYATGAEIAAEAGAFPACAPNHDAVTRTIRNHRRVSQGQIGGFEDLSIQPAPLHVDDCPFPDITVAAMEAWDRALELGHEHGFRNAQATAVGAAGLVGTLLDAGSSGIDPTFTQVRFHRRDDGTFERVIDPVIPRGLKALGYSKAASNRIVHHALGHGHLDECPTIDPASLVEKGFTEEALERLAPALREAYDIKYAFNVWTLGRGFCEEELGVPSDLLNDYGFDLLRWLGFSETEIANANRYCCGTLTVSGAADLKPAHARVFDGGIAQGRDGGATVSAEARVRMAAAVQGLISGAVVTNLVLPHQTGIEDCRNLIVLGWHLGLKQLALHREGAKLSDPVVEAVAPAEPETLPTRQSGADLLDLIAAPIPAQAAALAEGVADSISGTLLLQGEASPEDVIDGRLPPPRAPNRQIQERLPNRRKGYTQKATIAGQKVYLRTGEYDDGRVGEIFIDVPKADATVRSLVNNLAISISIGLQYGVPLTEFVDSFAGTQFEPSGEVGGNEAVTRASSILDYVFRELAISYLGRSDMADGSAEALMPANAAVGRMASSGYVRGPLTLLQGGKDGGD